jgi:hypothetical protein
MMDAHPQLAIPGESHFIPALWRRRASFQRSGHLDSERLAREATRQPHFQWWGVPEEAVLRRVRELPNPGFADVIASLYLEYASQHGKDRWGDKTPQYGRVIPELSEIFPGARFVHIIRDGRNVALSYLSIEWGPSTIWDAALQWRRDVCAARLGGAVVGPGRYIEVRYEDLVSSPEDVLRAVCAFVDLPFDPRMRSSHETAPDRIQHRPDRVGDHASSTRPPGEGLRDWGRDMPPRQLLAFEAVAGDLLSDLGYERARPEIGAADRARARVRVWLADARMSTVRLRRRVGLAPPAGGRKPDPEDLRSAG